MPTDAQLAELLHLAEHAARHAYAPYSHFYVGAALLTAAGQTATGCNVENASYRLTTCAEQAAITSAITQYGPALRIQAIAIFNRNDTACQPCGACRQTIAEFAGPDCLILFPGPDGPTTRTLADLLPAAFHLEASAS